MFVIFRAVIKSVRSALYEPGNGSLHVLYIIVLAYLFESDTHTKRSGGI